MEYNYELDKKLWELKYGKIKYLKPGEFKKNNITKEEEEEDEK